MLGTLMFFSMRTNMTFAHVLPMALSCVLAYTTSSVIMYSMEDEAMEDDNWGWVAALLAVSSALCLSGHRNLEYQRRLAFLSLHASFAVLKDLQVSDADCFLVEGRESLNTTGSFRSGGKGPETRLGRLKKGTQLLQRLSTSAHGTGNPAFRNALKALIDVLVEAREDLAQAERLLAPDVAELLEQKGVDDEAHLKLLELFDELPPVPPLPPQAGRKLEQEGYGSFTAKTEVSDDKEQTEVWGWDVLPSAGGLVLAREGVRPSVKKEMLLSPLAAAGEAILIPAALGSARYGSSDEMAMGQTNASILGRMN
ncbi:unnamed protein product [Effrenium voratum]|nr:unnamed protein product [Effrenium voratum]